MNAFSISKSVVSNQWVKRNNRELSTLSTRCNRLGGVTAVMALTLPVFAIMAAFAINAAHMQLTKTELMVATDSAARAGGRAFSETQTVQDAIDAASSTAAFNTVNGVPLQIGDSDVDFGTSSQPSGAEGRYEFSVIPTSTVAGGGVIASAVRVSGRRDSSSMGGEVTHLIPGLLDQTNFEPVSTAVAMQVDRDISLVLDRSGSMEWFSFDWPSGTNPWNYNAFDAAVDAGVLDKYGSDYYYASGEDSDSYQQWAWEFYYELGPAPREPWEDLVAGVNAFLNVLEETPQEEQVSIASYSSYASLDCYLKYDYDYVRSTVDNLDTSGSTAIGRGMDEGIKSFFDNASRTYAAKTMVVMTDGNHNSGHGPKGVAEDFVALYDITIHTITFGDGADQALMQEVADIGGGKHYHAETGQELVEVYQEIANNLPTILTQ